MSRCSILSVGLLAIALSSAGCAGAQNSPQSPNAPSVDQQAGSNDGSTRSPQPPPTDRPPLAGTCVAEKAQWAVGQAASRQLLERARVDATASVARYIRPNEAITMEFSAARLNLYLNERDVVHNVVCG